ncbi:MAG: hypothetical protein JWO30_2166, partial [Fibrobacteres bacterium]|nr:hypothetical protein [Fibrobacterota bacterium]
MPAIKPFPSGFWIIIALTLCALFPAQAQLRARAFNYSQYLSNLEFQLPWDGPGAAVFNPAMLGEANQADLRTGFYTALSGKGYQPYSQLAAKLFGGLYAGIGYYKNTSPIDGSSAVYEQDDLHPMLAYGLKDIKGSGYGLSFGAAFPMRGYNAFGAVNSTVTGFDLGLHFITPSDFFYGGFHVGLAFLDLLSGGVKLPEDKGGDFQAQPANGDFSLLWSTPGGLINLFGDLNMHGEADLAEGPDPKRGIRTVFFRTEIKTYGIELRPIPYL